MRKLLAAILAIMMLLSMTSFAMAEEPLTVTVFRGDPGDQPTEDNKIYKMIEEEFGVKFEIEFLAGDLDETLGTKIAGEDYPDLFDGVEIYNACNPPLDNLRAVQWAANNGLPPIAGSDRHYMGHCENFGILVDRRIRTEAELAQVLMEGEYSLNTPGV